MPERIAALEKTIVANEALLADAGLFTRDPAAYNKAVSVLQAARNDLEAAEERWLELEEMREALIG